MLKIGEVILDSSRIKYNVIWYSDKQGNERIDVMEYLDLYDPMDTSECVASTIKGTSERIYGSRNIIEAIYRIKDEAAFLRVAETRDTKIEDSVIRMRTYKSSADGTIEYDVMLKMAKLEYEHYKTSLGELRFDTIQDTTYVANDRPMNWDDYEVVNSFSGNKDSKTVKTEQAEFYPYEELLRRHPEVTHVLDNDYVVIESYEEAEQRLNEWINSKNQLKSVDIESLSTDWGPDSDNRITGVFLGYGEGYSTYFPFRQQNFDYNLPIEYLRKIFDAVNNQPAYPEVIILAHNAKFEIQGFYQEFREYIRVDVDTYILGVLVDPLIKKGSHTLKALASKVDHKRYLSLEDIFVGPIKFNVLPPSIVKLYGCPDATSPAKVYKYLMNKLPKDEFFVKRLEMSLIYVKAMNEFYGIDMEQNRLLGLIEDEEYKVELLSDIFKRAHKTSRNINSSDVLSEIIYHKLRAPVEVRTDKGKPATSKYAIDRIIQLGMKEPDPDKPISPDIVDRHGKTIIPGKELSTNKYPTLIVYQAYKKCTKELGALRRLRDKSVNGRFKFYINQVGAGSNRQTSDAHQFSDTMKSCAISDSKYHGLVSCDWKQVELRILAGLAGQTDLMELEADPNVDIHRAILSIIQGIPMWMISEEMRKKGKSVNFGVVYMMTEYGLARRDFGPAYTQENLNEEREKITSFFNGLPKIKALLKKNEEFLKKNGYIKTAFNYYRYFPELLDPTFDKKDAQTLVRSGNNTPVQGTGAQMLKIVETKVWNYIKAKGWDKEKDYDGTKLPMVRMILPIHDEILLSYDKTIPKEEIIYMFKECMELDIDGMPPFFAAPAFIDNWLEAKNPVYEVDIPFRDLIVEEYKKGNYLLEGKDYVQTLVDYRNGEIKSYMEDLISKYHTVDEVAKHVTHDSLTHTIIENLIPDAKERKKLTHEERIHEAVRRYMEDLDSKGELQNIITAVEDEEDRSEYFDVDEWTTNYTYIDANGDLITEVAEGGYEDNTEYFEEESYIEPIPVDPPRYLWCSTELILDLTGLDEGTTANSIMQEVQKLCTPDGFFSITLVIGSKTVLTKLRINPYQKEIKEIFDNALSGKVEV